MCGRPTGTFVLRVTLGGIFLFHGIIKLMDMNPVIAFFGNIGLPPVVAWIVAILQVVAGALVVIGIRVRTASILLAGMMIGSIVLVKWGQGFHAMELNVVLLGLSLGLATLGCGRYSLCSMQHGNCKECDTHAGTCGCDCGDNKNNK